MAKKQDKTEGGIVKVEEALSKTEQWIESNQKILTIVIGAIIIVVLIFRPEGLQSLWKGVKRRPA